MEEYSKNCNELVWLQAIKDIHLLLIVVSLVAIDVVFFSVWVGKDPFLAEILTFEDQIRKAPDQDVFIIPALYQCSCRYKTYFLVILFAYKGLQLFFGLFLAWETRKVNIPALNDSKYIGMSVYNVFVLSIICFIVMLAFEESMYYKAPYAILALCLIVATTVTLLLVFIPKIFQFYRDDEAQGTAVFGNLDLMEGQNRSNCKGTQTDYEFPGSKGNEGLCLSDEMSQKPKEARVGTAQNPQTNIQAEGSLKTT